MELRQIQYFKVIAEEEHFGRASTRLRIAQPALSRQVKLLEAELGLDLFERLPRGVRLTAAGATFLGHCTTILHSLGQAVTATKAVAAGSQGVLRLGFIEVAAWSGLIPETLRIFRRRYPAVRLELSAMPSASQLIALTDGTLDAGFLYNPPDDPALVSLPMAAHGLMLAVPAGHSLAAEPSITLDRLADQPFIGFRRQASPVYHDQLSEALNRAGFTPTILQEMESEADMLALVNAGAGIAFVNSCQRWRCPDGVILHNLPQLQVTLQLAFVYRRDSGLPALPHLIRLLGEIDRT